MTRLKGKVISRPLTVVPREGAQVIRFRYNNPVPLNEAIEIVETVSEDRLGFKSGGWQPNIKDLYELCVEYVKENYPKPNQRSFITVPLKYSQWQAAIDTGEVDSDREVSFIIENTIARVIPEQNTLQLLEKQALSLGYKLVKIDE
jgi:hypothetical protein